MSERVPYLYSILRLVPNLERGEALNVGLMLFCRPQRFLRVRYVIDTSRIGYLAPQVDIELVQSRLESLRLIADGDKRGGPVAELDIGERFHWLSNVSNTMIQPGDIHSGLTHDAEETFTRLFTNLVAASPHEP